MDAVQFWKKFFHFQNNKIFINLNIAKKTLWLAEHYMKKNIIVKV